MKPAPAPPRDLPLYEPDEGATYSLEIVAKLSGLTTETILHYKQQGFIRPAPATNTEDRFDDDALRILRCIDHLRSTCNVNEAGLKLILEMMDELDRLRLELQARH